MSHQGPRRGDTTDQHFLLVFVQALVESDSLRQDEVLLRLWWSVLPSSCAIEVPAFLLAAELGDFQLLDAVLSSLSLGCLYNQFTARQLPSSSPTSSISVPGSWKTLNPVHGG